MGRKAKNTDTSDKPVNKGGRPPRYATAQELDGKVQGYFDRAGKRPTLSGLAHYLGFESRQSMYDYEKRTEEFSYIIKKARLRVEEYYEELLVDDTVRPAGPIFALKQFGWADRHEVAGEGGGPVKIEIKYV
jgi:hypothetical protein